ncbi:vgr related protein [Novosphingobium sp. ZN18A2]|uniref:vgr related protein n=1 Tax=Novosphingobium sp. ZN18A2 TaxID=3079861 RepID=UPI0030D6094E
MFGTAVETDAVRIRRRRFFPFQPRQVAMAPCGHVHFHPRGSLYHDDFSLAPLTMQSLFLHEMTHVWQAQQRGRWYLVLMRHPLCRYDYAVRAGWPLARYGLEQQAEIVRHAFLMRNGVRITGVAESEVLESILPFGPSGRPMRAT